MRLPAAELLRQRNQADLWRILWRFLKLSIDCDAHTVRWLTKQTR